MAVKIVKIDRKEIMEAARTLRSGKLVAFPTETVYGLGGDAHDDMTVRSIFKTKGRPSNNPLIIHVSSIEMAKRYGVFSKQAVELATNYWPGPLTLVLPLKEGHSLSRYVHPGSDTIAIRMPGNDAALAMIEAFDQAVAAPSANRSGHVSPTQAQHVAADFKECAGNLSLILDGGACEVGIESTVIDCTGKTLSVLRKGSLVIDGAALSSSEGREDVLLSPGRLASHYAPRLPVRLNAEETYPHEALLAFGDVTSSHSTLVLNLSSSGDLEEAALHLYDYLRRLDQSGKQGIAVMPIPGEGVGQAINDRLQRAAAPKDS